MFRVVRMQRTALIGGLCMALVMVVGAVFYSQATQANVDLEGPWTVYLTFDDGPSKITPQVLDVLQREQVAATFFVIGTETPQGLAMYQRILEEGHSLGLHTFSHQTNSIYRSADAFLEDFGKQADWVQQQVGVQPRIYRFPGGSHTVLCKPSVVEQIRSTLSAQGYVCYDWHIPSNDSTSYTLPQEEIVHNVLSAAKKQTGKDLILLFHDDGLRSTLPGALEQIIPYFKERGYLFGSLSPYTPGVEDKKK